MVSYSLYKTVLFHCSAVVLECIRFSWENNSREKIMYEIILRENTKVLYVNSRTLQGSKGFLHVGDTTRWMMRLHKAMK